MTLTKATYSMIQGAVANVLDFGADPTGGSDSTAAVLAAIASLRSDPKTIIQNGGGSATITAYSSGTVYFPKGKYILSPDQLQIAQDLGLKLVGAGSRRTNNAVFGATSLVFEGTSSGYGFQSYGNGGRGLTFEDLDICYDDSNFTGSLVDTYDSPGLTMTRCYVGCYGVTAPTRLSTAAACLRSTYDEFMSFTDCVFSGADLGWWSDETRTLFGNTFGGSVTSFISCVFYDFVTDHVSAAGTRTRTNVAFRNCAFNPITVSPSANCVNMSNVDALVIDGCFFTPSNTEAPANFWLYLANATGSVTNCAFNDLAACASIYGALNFNNNLIYCTTGVRVNGGVICGSGNEFGKATNGWIIDASTAIVPYQLNLGPDVFKSDVGTSYYIPADSALFSGTINYSKSWDSSTNKFSNPTSRITIKNSDSKLETIATTPYSILTTDTGRTFVATGSANQVFNLPDATPGVFFGIFKPVGYQLIVNCAVGDNFYTGSGAAKTVATAAATDIGSFLQLRSYGSAGWVCESIVGPWTFT